MAYHGEQHVYQKLLAIKIGQSKFVPVRSTRLLATHYKRAKHFEPGIKFKAVGCEDGAIVTRIT